MGLRTQLLFLTEGNLGRTGLIYAQCFWTPSSDSSPGQIAPLSIHFLIKLICLGVSGAPVIGIRGSPPVPSRRLSKRLSLLFPGMIDAPEIPPLRARVLASRRN